MSKQRSHKRGGPKAATPKPVNRPIWPWLLVGLLVGWLVTKGKAGSAETGPGPTGIVETAADSTDPADAFDAPQERVDRGASLFATNCSACHGAGAVGQDIFRKGGGQRSDGSRIAPALNGTAHAWHHRPLEIFTHIKTGSPLPDSPMLGWEGRLTDEEIVTIMSYINSLWSDRIRASYFSQPHH